MTKNVIPLVLLTLTSPFSGTYSSLQIQTDDLDRLWPAEKPVGKQAIGQNPDAAKNKKELALQWEFRIRQGVTLGSRPQPFCRKRL